MTYIKNRKFGKHSNNAFSKYDIWR